MTRSIPQPAYNLPSCMVAAIYGEDIAMELKKKCCHKYKKKGKRACKSCPKH